MGEGLRGRRRRPRKKGKLKEIAFLLTFAVLMLGIRGLRVFVVLSNSMAPEFMRGDVVFTLPQHNYSVGDVVLFDARGSKKTVMHRITKIKSEIYITKGDSNEFEDAEKLVFEEILGKVQFSIPLLGMPFLEPKFSLLFIIPLTSFFVGILFRKISEMNDAKIAVSAIW